MKQGGSNERAGQQSRAQDRIRRESAVFAETRLLFKSVFVGVITFMGPPAADAGTGHDLRRPQDRECR
jgi:hypothetical protein